eukprot:PhF_6_TR5596/c1_g1_i5/m.8045
MNDVGKYTQSAVIADVVLTSGGGVDATEILSNLDWPDHVYPPFDVICVYLSKGNADPNVLHIKSRTTVLMYSKETCKVALEVGVTPATLNAQDEKDGLTALMHAALKADPDWTNLLLTAHADVTIKNKKGQTAQEITWENTYDEEAPIKRTYWGEDYP